MHSHRERIGPSNYLYKPIQELWDPLVEWFEGEFDVKLKVFSGNSFTHLDVTQSDAMEVFQKLVLAEAMKDHYDLVTLHAMVHWCSSFVVGVALFRGHITSAQAFEASMLIKREQTKMAGLVMGEHDLLFAEQQSKLSAVTLFQHLHKMRHVVE